jgi:hypothetical protein
MTDPIIYIAIGIVIGLIFMVMALVSRGKMYIPEHWHAFLPFSIILGALYLQERIKEFSLGVAAIEIGALISWAGLEIKGAMYQAMITSTGADRPAPKSEPETLNLGAGFIPTKRAIMQPSAQVVAPVQINQEQQIARTLIAQHMGKYEPDLTEEFWIKRGNFKGTRQEFTAIKAKWLRLGITYKKGTRKNAKHDIKSWRKVHMIADGHTL